MRTTIPGEEVRTALYDTNVSGTISRMAGSGRLAADDWVAAGLEVLVESGIAGVKILPISTRLGVTRGSFYWHFSGRKELLSQLLAAWEGKNTEAIVEAATVPGSLIERYVALSRLWLGWSDFDPRLDVAVREWGRSDKEVLARVRAADERRVAALATMVEPEGHSPEMTLHRARTLYRMQMGWYDGTDTPAGGIGESSAAYFEIFLGRSPTRSEREAIAAGHRGP